MFPVAGNSVLGADSIRIVFVCVAQTGYNCFAINGWDASNETHIYISFQCGVSSLKRPWTHWTSALVTTGGGAC